MEEERSFLRESGGKIRSQSARDDGAALPRHAFYTGMKHVAHNRALYTLKADPVGEARERGEMYERKKVKVSARYEIFC